MAKRIGVRLQALKHGQSCCPRADTNLSAVTYGQTVLVAGVIKATRGHKHETN